MANHSVRPMESAPSQNLSSETKQPVGKKRRIILIGTIVSVLLVISLVSVVVIKVVRSKSNQPTTEQGLHFNQQEISEAIDSGSFQCPPPGDPLTIDLNPNAKADDYHAIVLANSPQGILCTLLEVSTDETQAADGNLKLKPIGRSYNGNGWEPYQGLHSSFNTVPLGCSDSGVQECSVVLPALEIGRKYILKSYEHSLGPRDEAARFLEKITFGPTTSEIDAFVDSGNDPSELLQKQLELPIISSHREFFRRRANSFHPETTTMGTLSFKPCEAGARYRRFVFLPKDKDRIFTLETSPVDANYKLLKVGGKIRSVIPGLVKVSVGGENLQVVPDGSYRICRIWPGTMTGHKVGIRVGTQCYDTIFDEVSGNPVVKLDQQHMGLVSRFVEIDGNAMPVMEDFFMRGTEMLELTSDINDAACRNEETTGAPEVVSIASYGGQFWIHTPFFKLVDNEIESPLQDGGKAAVEETKNAPYERLKVSCANAPRTFLNEDSCFLSEDACSSHDTEAGTAAIVCGSPFEVASSPEPNAGSLGRGSFDLATKFNKTEPQKRLEEQRETVWLEIALKGKDQLRQRMAWALSQILVVSPNGIEHTRQTESFLTYYDIFVRNAFGNYFDILKEVTYSPLMAEMLTYHNGVSTGSAWVFKQTLQHADENFARELLQLFSVGLHLLNDDGTVKTDLTGHELRTYTNRDISEYAKVFVGLNKQPNRGNIEGVSFSQNEIDPLEIVVENKDHFPKLGMDNKYVGDGYPLCKDIPPGNFLKKGATFRFLGSNPYPELINEDYDKRWESDPVRVSLNKSSKLSSILCNRGAGDPCAPAMKVVLDSDVECVGVECSLQEIRVFELFEGSDLWFEYTRPPCVNHAFYEGAQSIRRRRGATGHAMCGDPDTYAASAFCCESADASRNNGFRQELYSGERIPLLFAEKRCSSLPVPLELCDNPIPTQRDCNGTGGCSSHRIFYWSSSKCSIAAKINQEGKVAVVHNPQIDGVDTYKMVAADTEMYFHVDWVSGDSESFISNLVGNCRRFGCIDGDGTSCICPISIEEEAAFINGKEIISADNVMSIATQGSYSHIEETFHPVAGVNGVSQYPRGDLNSETVFRIVDSNNQVHFRKNTKNHVHLGNGAGTFRNPVTFFSLSEPTTRDASYETDAALQHAFFHPNMAPFISFRLAQRFGVSNPSPRYLRNISRAFRSGIYFHPSSRIGIGSGQYGCLKATIAAILLDNESLDTVLDADPVHGSIHEPYLKLVRLLRSLEFRSSNNHPLLTVGADLQLLIGQQSHQLPNVFSFFRPEYQPHGRVSSAEMMSPESQVLSGPTSVQLMNTMISFLKYGASTCYSGFGIVHAKTCRVGATWNGGSSSYDPAENAIVTATGIIDDLSTLLTSGRLDESRRQVIKQAYEDTINRGKSNKEALINAQQLIVASPEFHSTNLGQPTGQPRAPTTLPESTNFPYKAVVLVMLPGGYDSFNVLVPKECEVANEEGKTVRDQYLQQRGAVGFDEGAGEFDLDIDATGSNQPCSRFAVHDELKIVKDLYDAGDLAFFANAGIINNSGLTKQNYDSRTRSQLFAHNAMQREIAKVDPYDLIAGTGIMGRAKDILSKNGHVVGTISIDNPSISVDGMQDESQPASIVGRGGSKKFAIRPETEFDFDIEEYTRALNGKADKFSGIFGETWSEQFMTGINEAEEYQSIFDRVTLDESIWTDSGIPNYTGDDKLEKEHWEKWSSLLKLIQSRDIRNVDRDFFFTELGSWDTHNQMKEGLRSQLYALNFGLEMFVEQAKLSGIWDKVTVVIASDFGRTLTPNSNDGTDHGWGGHYMVMGGDVKGGQVHGEYPNDLTPTGLLVDGRGRFIPTTSWDSIWNGILEWTGVTEHTDLDYCLPNRFNTVDPVVGTARSFPLLRGDSVFESQEENDGLNLRGRRE